MPQRLEPIAPDLWTITGPQRMFGLHLGTRMTVVRQPSGGLWLHSPIALSPELRDDVASLGNVEHIVAPNLYHHVYAGEWAQAFPKATLHGAPGLDAKRKDLKFGAMLGTTEDGAPWADTFAQQRIDGTMLGEVVFLHKPTGSIISSDLVENMTACSHWPTRVYLNLNGVLDKPGLPYVLRLVFRDRKAARADIDKILSWTFERIVLAHGSNIEQDAADILKATYAWL